MYEILKSNKNNLRRKFNCRMSPFDYKNITEVDIVVNNINQTNAINKNILFDIMDGRDNDIINKKYDVKIYLLF